MKNKALLILVFFTSSLIGLSFYTDICATVAGQKKTQNLPKPNIIILLVDDMGYGDLQCYGNPTIRTPNIDALATGGLRFTSFQAAPWCVPSRAELLTGRYMTRIEFNGGTGADGKGGLPDSELTLAESLKTAGYNTGMAGKWHLGYSQKKFLPTNQGFDSWLGLPYSNDYMRPYVDTDEPLVMYRNTDVVEYPVNQDSLTVKYTQEAVRFIQQQNNKDDPFFFYLAYNMPHLPIHTAPSFFGKSNAGLYGDVIETIDWSVGQVVKTLKEMGIYDKTIIFFASDNGPWQNAPPRMFRIPTKPEGDNWEKRGAGNKPWHVGSAGPLRGHKATTWDGGTRVPAIIHWPGHIKPQVSDALAANLDIYRTMIEIGDGELPEQAIDGYNLLPYLLGQTDESPRHDYVYIRQGIEAMRIDDWKLKFNKDSANIELFHMQIDPSEKYDRASEKPKIVHQIQNRMKFVAEEIGTTVYEFK